MPRVCICEMGRTALGLSASQAGLSVSDTWEGLVSLHTHFREERGWPQGKHTGSNPRGARSKAGGETRNAGISTSTGGWEFESERCLGQSSRCKGLPEGEAIWETVYAKHKEEIC